MQRILLYILSGEAKKSWDRAIEISQGLSATLFALYIVDQETVSQVARMRNRGQDETAVDIEEEGWKYLYYLEDTAVEREVRTALFLEEGDPIDILKKFVREKDIDLLIVGFKKAMSGGVGRKYERMLTQLIEHIPCPVLVEKEGGR